MKDEAKKITLYPSSFILHPSSLNYAMHELSIAMSMVEMATEEVARQGGVQINALHLKLGRLSGVVKEALLFSWDVACEGTPLAGSHLLIEDVQVAVYCPVCQAERTLDSIQYFFCPVCQAPTPEVVRGKELEVVALEIQ
jgi:hydrogenase nickel incorporation protein HypA/HybF